MRVLVVEDSEPLRKPVVKALKASGYAVDETGDGEEGFWFARTHDYDAIVLDIMLPGMEGREILRRLRAGGCDTPVLFLTAKDALADKIEGFRLGADDYLVKSFAIEELLARVGALARRGYQQTTPEIRLGDLVLDVAKKEACRAGHVIKLSALQFALLEYLMLRRGRVVSRAAIEEHVYSDADAPQSNAVDTAICSLRKLIAVADDCPPLIHTRRGLGYVMEERE